MNKTKPQNSKKTNKLSYMSKTNNMKEKFKHSNKIYMNLSNRRDNFQMLSKIMRIPLSLLLNKNSSWHYFSKRFNP